MKRMRGKLHPRQIAVYRGESSSSPHRGGAFAEAGIKPAKAVANLLFALVFALGLTATIPSESFADDETPSAENNWAGTSYYQGFQGASTYVPNSSRAPIETYGFWLDDPDGGYIDDVVVTDTSKYVQEVMDVSQLNSGLTGDDLWNALNVSPAYYYNIITEPYDATGEIIFQWERQGPGGNWGSYANMGKYVQIYSGLGEDGLGDPDKLVATCTEDQFTVDSSLAMHYSSWVCGFRWTIPANTLEPDTTYYLILEKGSSTGNGDTLGRTFNGNIVFEFTTDTSQQPVQLPEGDIVSPYYGKQGTTAVVDLNEPDASGITTNITVSRNNNCYYNEISTKLDADSTNFTFTMSGSQSQHFTETGAQSYCYPNIHIYDSDGVTIADGEATLDSDSIVASWTSGDDSDMSFVFTERLSPTYMTVNSGVLEPGQDYYLVFESNCGVSSGSTLTKPVIFKFSTQTDTTALSEAITNAQSAMEGVNVGATGKGLSEGDKYANTVAFEAIENDLATAQSTLDNADSTQDEIDAAASALQATTESFTSQVKTVGSDEVVSSQWKRLSGSDRYNTSAEVTGEQWAEDSFDTVVLTTGENFPDALSASALAGLEDAPLMITTSDSISIPVLFKIAKLASDDGCEVIIVGGESAVSEHVAKQVDSIKGVTVTRVSGSTRFDTANSVYTKGAEDGSWGSSAIVVSGDNYADALSASSYAYADNAPIFLAHNGELDSDSVSAIQNGGFDNVVIVGGSSAVDADSVEEAIGDDSISYTVIAGSNRYETSQMFMQWACGDQVEGIDKAPDIALSYSNTVVASGEGFADALSAVSIAGPNNAPVLLVSEDSSDVTSDALSDLGAIEQGYIVGGEAAVPATIEDSLNAILEQ
ncbi:MAG: cell wall-binding repeat-containing protein [Coriobacteriales bacterium]|jgi:putative cell wall-binding protein